MDIYTHIDTDTVICTHTYIHACKYIYLKPRAALNFVLQDTKLNPVSPPPPASLIHSGGNLVHMLSVTSSTALFRWTAAALVMDLLKPCLEGERHPTCIFLHLVSPTSPSPSRCCQSYFLETTLDHIKCTSSPF